MKETQVVCSLISVYFDRSQISYNKKKLYKTLGYLFRDMFNFDFSEKYLRVVYPPHFVYNFSRKMFPMLYSIN